MHAYLMVIDKKIAKKVAAVFLLIAAVFAGYYNIFQNNFAWDDFFFIVNNIHIRDSNNVHSFFTEPSTGYLYRPLRSIFYAISYNAWKLNTFGYHLNSLILHTLATLTLFFITLKVSGKTGFSFTASLFFAAHPIHTARITNMTAAFDVFGILFLLIALLSYILFSKNNKKGFLAVSLAFYFSALFSSEEAITMILILFLFDFSFNHTINLKNFKFLLRRYIPYFIITIFYLIARFSVLQRIGRGEFYFEHSFFGTLLTTLKIFAGYIIILLLPINLTIERVVKFETMIFSFYFLASFFILLAVSLLFIRSYKQSKILFFSIGWFFITLLPFANLVPQLTIMADRYLYLPSYGFCLVLAFLTFKIGEFKSIKKYSGAVTFILVILIASSYTFLTIQRNSEWRDNFTLLSSDVKKSPSGTRIHHALGLYYRDMGDYETAFGYATRAVELASKNYNAYENLGTIRAYQERYDEAILFYEQAIELNPDFYLAHNNLGLVYSYLGDYDKSLLYLHNAVELNPKLSKAHNDLGVVHAQIGNFELAVEEIGKAIEINPFEADYYINLALIYKFLEDSKKAEELLIKAMELEPDNEKAKNLLDKLRP
jgi:protein O-mannosyl-transferase